MSNALNTVLLYKFLRLVAQPYKKWPSYKTGVINDRGDIIVNKNKRSPAQKRSFPKFDLMVLKLKRLLNKIPGGRSKIASYAAALWLIKEHNEDRDLELVDESDLEIELNEYIANGVTGGHIASIGVGMDGEPGVHRKKGKKKKSTAIEILRRNKK